eukprot:s2416_g2.t1
MTTKAEQMLVDAWTIHQSIHEGQAKHMDTHHVDNCFGRLCIRTILHLCNKAKTGSKECKEFASLEAIVEAFTTEVYKTSEPQGAEASKSDEKPMVDILSAKPHVVHPAFVEEHQRGMVTVALHLVHTKHSSTNDMAMDMAVMHDAMLSS